MIINGYGLFRDFTTQEAAQMKEWATNIVLHGKVAQHPDPEWVRLMESNHYNERQRLLPFVRSAQRVLPVPGAVTSPIDKGAPPMIEARQDGPYGVFRVYSEE